MRSFQRSFFSVLFLVAVSFSLQCGSDGATVFISAFTLTSTNPTTSESVAFTLSTASEAGGLHWLVNESADAPELDDANWSETAPTSYELSGDRGVRTLYAWLRSGSSIVSPSKSLAIHWLNPGEEDIVNWNKVVTYSETSMDIPGGMTLDSSGNVYAVGTAVDPFATNPSYQWMIKKYDSSGVEDTENWDKAVTRANESTMAGAVALDSEGNLYAGAKSDDLVGSDTDDDWWIKKYDSSGTEITNGWDKKLDGGSSTASKEDHLSDLLVDSSDNLIVIGYGEDLTGATADDDWWIQKFNSAGTVQWEKKIDGGGLENENAIAGALDSSQNIYVVGSGFELAGPATDNDWWIKKFESDGTEITTGWDKKIDGAAAGSDHDDQAFGVAVDSSDNVYVVGYGEDLDSTDSGPDIWIKKFESDGTEITSGWNKKINRLERGAPDYAMRVGLDSSDNVYVLTLSALNEPSFVWKVMKFDSSGTEDSNWGGQLPAPLYISELGQYSAMAVTPGGDVFLGLPSANEASSTSGYDWLIKRLIGE